MSAHAHGHDDHGHGHAPAPKAGAKLNYNHHGKPIHPTGFDTFKELHDFALKTLKIELKDDHGKIVEVKAEAKDAHHDHAKENHGEHH